MVSPDVFFSNKSLSALIQKYVGPNFDIQTTFQKSSEDLQTSLCYIPVLGTQGSGKSSFLNALLFNDIVLPVDADETTCIPTAISYGTGKTPVAYLCYLDGKRKRIDCTEKALAEYVHQAHNPENKKGIAQIEIQIQHPMLEKGIVLVDLPGVGSITAANQKVTSDYLKKSTAAIFMLRTVPPITRSESSFIQGALPLMGYVFWVQNQWEDETIEEVQDGEEQNFSVLKKIAATIHYPENQINEPDVVCVKKALDGGIKRDLSLLKESNIDEFRNRIKDFAVQWKKELICQKEILSKQLIQLSIHGAEEKIQELSGDVKTQMQKIIQKKKEAEKIQKENRQLYDDALSF